MHKHLKFLNIRRLKTLWGGSTVECIPVLVHILNKKKLKYRNVWLVTI